jgi:hypothetical protein
MTRHLLDSNRVSLGVGPKSDLSQGLVSERTRHDWIGPSCQFQLYRFSAPIRKLTETTRSSLRNHAIRYQTRAVQITTRSMLTTDVRWPTTFRLRLAFPQTTSRTAAETHTTQVDQTTFGQENKVSARRHSVTVNLRLNVGDALSVLLQPSNVDFTRCDHTMSNVDHEEDQYSYSHVKVSDAAWHE